MKKSDYKIILFTALAVFLLTSLLGKSFSKLLYSIPVLRKINFLNPQAPIFITNREEIRISEGQDWLKAYSGLKSKVSAVFTQTDNGPKFVAGALNISSDGLFASVKYGFDAKTKYFIKLADGRIGNITKITLMPKSDLIILTSDLKDVSVTDFAVTKDFQSADRLVLVLGTLSSASADFYPGFVVSQTGVNYSEILDSDKPWVNLDISINKSIASEIPPGAVAADIKGRVAGMLSGENLVSAEEMNEIFKNYVKNQGNIYLPFLGFKYRYLLATQLPEVKDLQYAVKIQGEAVGKSAFVANSPAVTNGLLEDDIIISASGKRFSKDFLLSDAIRLLSPGDNFELEVYRHKQIIKMQIAVKQQANK